MLAGSPQLCPPVVENTFTLFFKAAVCHISKSRLCYFLMLSIFSPLKGSYAAKSVMLMLAVHWQ